MEAVKRGVLFCLEAEKAKGTSAEHMACQGQGHPSKRGGGRGAETWQEESAGAILGGTG